MQFIKTFTDRISQPILLSEPSHILGGDEFACTQQDGYVYDVDGDQVVQQKFWRCFMPEDQDPAKVYLHEWQMNNVDLNTWYWAKFYVPNAILMRTFKMRNGNVARASIKSARLFGSTNDENWEQIGILESPNTKALVWNTMIIDAKNYFKYYKLEVMPSWVSAMTVNAIEYTAKELE